MNVASYDFSNGSCRGAIRDVYILSFVLGYSSHFNSLWLSDKWVETYAIPNFLGELLKMKDRHAKLGGGPGGCLKKSAVISNTNWAPVVCRNWEWSFTWIVTCIYLPPFHRTRWRTLELSLNCHKASAAFPILWMLHGKQPERGHLLITSCTFVSSQQISAISGQLVHWLGKKGGIGEPKQALKGQREEVHFL